jgi:putative membrane protein
MASPFSERPFWASLLLSWLLLLVVARLVPGVALADGLTGLVAAFVLALLNALVRPALIVLTLPLTVLTLGLFLLVINALTFMLAAGLVPGFEVRDFTSALLASLLLSALNLIVHRAFDL